MIKSLSAIFALLVAAPASAQAGAQAGGSIRSNDQVRGALFGSSMSAQAEMIGAGRRRESQRRTVSDGTAEGALLTGAGVLSAAPYLGQLPVCAEADGRPSLDCQIIKKRQQSR